jgi:hypothetical protein
VEVALSFRVWRNVLLTKLQIVNSMLATVGESVVNDLDYGSPSVQQALSVFDSENFDFQTMGWWFNREYNVSLALDSEGKIAIPQGTVEFLITENIRHHPYTDTLRYAPRDNFVYDSVKHTFVHTCPLHADLMMLVDPETMPAVASVYLKHKCNETMHSNDDGDMQKWQMLNQKTEIAFKALIRMKRKYASTNINKNPQVARLKYRMNSPVGQFLPLAPIHTFPGQHGG